MKRRQFLRNAGFSLGVLGVLGLFAAAVLTEPRVHMVGVGFKVAMAIAIPAAIVMVAGVLLMWLNEASRPSRMEDLPTIERFVPSCHESGEPKLRLVRECPPPEPIRWPDSLEAIYKPGPRRDWFPADPFDPSLLG